SIVARGRTPAQALRERPDLASVKPDHFTDDTIYRRTVRFYHQLEAQPLLEAWSRVQARVYCFHGAHDWVTAPEDSQRIAELAPHGEFHAVPDADHTLSWVDSSERTPGRLPTVPGLLELRLAPALRRAVLD